MSRLLSLPAAVRRMLTRVSTHRARHGPDRPRVWVDLHRTLHSPAAIGDNDELTDLRNVVDPRSRDFGTDVSALIERYLDHQILCFSAPITAIHIEATVNGEYRDGGFRVMVTIADTLTVTSRQWHPDAFLGAPNVPDTALATVVETADRLVRDFYATAATTGK